jgi:hypothetical protein
MFDNKCQLMTKIIMKNYEPHETTNIDVLEADQSVKAIRKRVETENVAISKAYNDEKRSI